MKTKLIVGGKVIRPSEIGWFSIRKPEEFLPNGIYIFGRRNSLGLVTLAGQCFGERGIVIGDIHTSVERDHLFMQVRSEEVVLSDFHTKYGTLLDGMKIGKEVIASPGNYNLKLGNTFSCSLLIE